MPENTNKTGGKNRKRNAIIQLVLVFLLVILFNILAGFAFRRFDLTAEKRFTLNPATISLIEKLDDIVYIKVYLEGDLPAGYKRLSNATREILDEFRSYNTQVEYEFINPSEGKTEKERKAVYQELMKQGLYYTTPVEQKEAGVSQVLIWPGALITYKNKTIPLQLLNSRSYSNEQEMISRSITDLEYELTNTIRKLRTNIKPAVAFIDGHGELDSLETKDISVSLEEYYQVKRIRIDSNLTSLVNRSEQGGSNKFYPRYKAIIIAKPDSAFSEKDKFIIDQYIMRGGKVLWLLDRVNASMDSLQVYSSDLVYPSELNLDDQLLRYGARVNTNLLMDLRSASIPLVTGRIGNQPRMNFFRWYYFPLSIPGSNHPIVHNLNAIKFEFAGSIDTLNVSGIKKTVLLSSSKRTQLINAPGRISLNILKEKPDPNIYRYQNIPMAVLLEGRFTSHFQNFRNDLRSDARIGFLPQAEKETAMIIVGDGDIACNSVSKTTGRILPLGYDKFTGELFGNKDFLLNCINYLCDDSNLIAVRSREVKVRMLDEARIKSSTAEIQIQNVFIPVLLFILVGVLITFARKRKFGKS